MRRLVKLLNPEPSKPESAGCLVVPAVFKTVVGCF
jgi:hypothetical protein